MGLQLKRKGVEGVEAARLASDRRRMDRSLVD